MKGYDQYINGYDKYMKGYDKYITGYDKYIKGYLVNKPLQAAGMSADNVRG